MAFAQLGQGRQLFTTDCGGLVTTGKQAGQPCRDPNHGVEQLHQHLDNRGQRQRQPLPVSGTQGLGDNFREIEDGQRQQECHQGLPAGTKYLNGLGSHAGSAHGMGKGIEDEDTGDGFVQVRPDLTQGLRPARLLLQLAFHKSRGDRQQYRLQDGTQEGNTDRDQQIGDKQ